MSAKNFSIRFFLDQTPEHIFGAINNVRAWWTGDIEGDTDRLGAEFCYRYGDLHESRQKLTELVPGRKIAWHVTDGHLGFVEDQSGWKGTDIVFEIAAKDGRTELRFTHIGLVPSCECYDACCDGWEAYINGNLRRWIVTGQVQPDPFEADAANHRPR